MGEDRSSADVSVIIPTYNRQDLVLRALRSALSSSRRIREVIVVDDGSSLPISLPSDVASDTPIRLVRHEHNRGPSAARNTGLREATGRWVAFLDSDDVWLAGALDQRLAQAEEHLHQQGDVLACYVCAFQQTWKGRFPIQIRHPIGSARLEHFVSACWFAPGSCALMLREPVLRRVGLYDESLRRLEDLDWFIRFGLEGGIVVASAIVGAHVEVQSKAPLEAVRPAEEYLLAKYVAPGSSLRLSMSLRRRLRAYLLVERAASAWYNRKIRVAIFALACSFALVPRLRLHLYQFWNAPKA